MIGSRLKQGSCRLCLWESNGLWDIFGELAERRNFARKIHACVNINVSKDDGLSPLICPNCIYKIELFYDFQTSCKRSDNIQKRYNGVPEDAHADADAMEDEFPGSSVHCGVPVEMIDIKEEPLDDEVAADGVADEQFEDVEVQVEEVPVEAEQLEGGAKDKDKDEGQGGANGNGSCMQLTPPRSPSLASELTFSASEAGGSAEEDAPEQQEGEEGEGGGGRSWQPEQEQQEQQPEQQQDQQQQQQQQEEKPAPVQSRNRCRHCSKWFRKRAQWRAHERWCGRPHAPAAEPGPRCSLCSEPVATSARLAVHEYHCARRERRLATAAPPPGRPRTPPPRAKYTTQCRFCRRFFLRVAARRLHELDCAPRLGYALPPAEETAAWTGGRTCSLCGKQLNTHKGRMAHEYHCQRRARAAGSLPAHHCSRCGARLPSAELRLSHERSCGGQRDALSCRYCAKGHNKWRSLLTHEFHCRRKSLLEADASAGAAAGEASAAGSAQAEADAQSGTASPAAAERETEAAAGGGGDENEEGGDAPRPAQSTATDDEARSKLFLCAYCRKVFHTKSSHIMHECYCKLNVKTAFRGCYPCSRCRRLFRKRLACVMHERHCPEAADRTGVSGAADPVVPSAAEESRQLGSSSSDTPAPHEETAEGQREILPGSLESAQLRKVTSSPRSLPVVAAANKVDVWTCRYCDRVFRYRECLRTHEVECNAIATYQYSSPHHRQVSYFTCPLCRKPFKFRRKLHNHWKVCRARTCVAAEAAGPNGGEETAHCTSDQLDAIYECSPGDDCEEWRGWPGSESPTAADAPDGRGPVVLSCKLCHKEFSSRVLLELHTLNECVCQRIRNDHAYAQCESSGVDEFTLMRMARVELKRLPVCSCCGSVFRDRQGLADHELAERLARGRTTTEVEEGARDGPEASQLQKRRKLEAAAAVRQHLEDEGPQEPDCRTEQLSASDSPLPPKLTRQVYLEDSPEMPKLTPEVVDIQQLNPQQMPSINVEQQSSNQSLQQVLVRNCTEWNGEQLQNDLGKIITAPNIGLEQGNRIVASHLQQQEWPSNNCKQQQQIRLPNRVQCHQNFSEEHYGEETVHEKHCPNVVDSHET